MRIIPDGHLAFFRAMNDENLRSVAILEREAATNIGGGVIRKGAWQEVTRVPCRMQPVVKSFRTVTEDIRADQLEAFAYFLVITKHDFNSPQPATDRFRIQNLNEDGTVEWEKIVSIIGTTGPHTADSMKKWVCKTFEI